MPPFGVQGDAALWVGQMFAVPLELRAAYQRRQQCLGLAQRERCAEADARAGAERQVLRAPHVTLARLRNTRPDAVARFLGSRGTLKSEPFAVERFVLLSSRPNVGGGPYAIEAVYPLGRGHAGADDWED